LIRRQVFNHSSEEVIRAIFESAGDIQEENREDIRKYEERGFPPNLGSSAQDHERFKSNTESLLGALADQAIRSGVLTQVTLDQLIEEIVIQTGLTVDLTKKTIELSNEEKKLKENQVNQNKKEDKKEDKQNDNKNEKKNDKKVDNKTKK
jgi:hypothetical protein